MEPSEQVVDKVGPPIMVGGGPAVFAELEVVVI